MNFAKRFFYLILINIFVVVMASIAASLLSSFFGWDGQWTFYIIAYSLIGFGGAFLSLFLSKWAAKKFMGVRLIDPKTASGKEKEILDIAYSTARKARLPKMPEVGIFDSPDLNAFATGPSKSNSLTAVSSAAARRLSRQELEGIIAHEIAHIKNGDMVTMTLLMGLMNTMVMLAARLAARLIASNMRSRSWWTEHLIFIGLQIAFSVPAMIALNYFSRKREYRADEGGAKLAGSGAMIGALEALKTALPSFDDKGAEPGFARRRESYEYLQISGRQKANWFSTHPPLSARIERLKRRFS